MENLWSLFDRINERDDELDTQNQVDEKTIIASIRQAKKFFDDLKTPDDDWTDEQKDFFVKEMNELEREFYWELSELESELGDINQDEFDEYMTVIEEYQQILTRIEDKIRQAQIDQEDVSLPNLDWLSEEQIVEKMQKYTYEFLWINIDTYSNPAVLQFIKWVIDEVIFWNIELVMEIYNTNWEILLDMLDVLFSFEWLKAIAEALWESILDLFIRDDMYEKWKAFWELWLITFAGWIAFTWIKKWVKTGMKMAGIWAWTMELAWFVEKLAQKIPREVLDLLGQLWKLEPLQLFGKRFEGKELLMINWLRKAFEVNTHLLKWEDYAYLSSSATYMTLPKHKIKPNDLDIAVNPKSFDEFYDNFIWRVQEYRTQNWDNSITDLMFKDIETWREIDIRNKDDVLALADEWRWRIIYNIDDWVNEVWIEVELFPEKWWRWLSNLWFMSKEVVHHEVPTLDWKSKVEIPSLWPKSIAEWYVINFLNEFEFNSIEFVWQSWIKAKDAYRLHNIIQLLQYEWIISKPWDLLTFLDETIEKYRQLPKDNAYVQEALQRAESWKEKLWIIIAKFTTKIDQYSWEIKVVSSDLPEFDKFYNDVSVLKNDVVWLYWKYLSGEQWKVAIELKGRLLELEKYLNSIDSRIISTNWFAYFYEISIIKEIIDAIEYSIN